MTDVFCNQKGRMVDKTGMKNKQGFLKNEDESE